MDWHAMSLKEVFDKLNSSSAGLKENESKKRLSEYGANVIKEKKKDSLFVLFFRQFHSLLIYILIFAAAISAILGHFIDAFVIGIIVLIDCVIGFIQEYKAGEIIEKLKQSLSYKSIVIRDGERIEINSKSLVPGDVIVLESGNKIPADCRVIDSENLQANEAILTGESFPVSKNNLNVPLKSIISERKNMLYAGTTVLTGKTKAIIVETASRTEFGKIAKLVEKTESEKTPLEKKLDDFSKKISIVILMLVVLIFLFGIYLGSDTIQMFLTAISLAVGAIPEGLPAIIAITLAFAINQMHKDNVLIRKLPAAETLGRATVICTDKTGTLTKEELTIDKIYFDHKNIEPDKQKTHSKFSKILEIGLLCNDARSESHGIIGDPVGAAIVRLAEKYSVSKKEITEKFPKIKEFAFTSERKMMSIVRKNGRHKTTYVKGAPNIILEKCSREFVNGRSLHLTKKRKGEIIDEISKMESNGLRVIGLASNNITKVNQKSAEDNLVFYGLLGMIDPPRDEVKSAIKEAISAGIKVKIITGDSGLTTKAVAKKIGLDGEFIEGKDLQKIDSEERWNELVKTKTIFARVTPQQKLRIVETLKKQGEIVAVTGDGVNDILALKRSDIGVSMGIRGGDAARDASDIVLLDDNFASIVNAVKQGRRVYENIKKSIMFLLSVNAANIFIVIYSLLAGIPLPFLPLAILWMNIVTDSTPALALALEKPDKKIMKHGPENDEIFEGIWKIILMSGILNFFLVVLLYHWALARYSLEVSRTMAITASIFYAMFFIFSCKKKEVIDRDSLLDNRWLIYSVVFAIAIHTIAIYTPLGKAFEFVPLNLVQFALCIFIGALSTFFFEMVKMNNKD